MAVYFLRTKANTGMAPLYTRVRKRNPKITWEHIRTGVYVDIESWTKAQKSISAWNKYIQGEGKELNEKLNKVSQTIDLLFSEGKINSNDDKPVLENALMVIANNEAIREREEMEEREKRLKELAEQKKIQEKKYIWNFYEYFLNGIADKSIRHGSGKVYEPETVRVWRDFGTHLHNYCPMNMSFEDITQEFADKFRLFLENIPVMETTINKYVGCFRKLCRQATLSKVNTNAVSLLVWKERTVHDNEKRAEIYLTDEELDALYDMKLSGTDEEVRDVFFLGVLSAQRISDYSTLDKSNFTTTLRGTNIISLNQEKTDNGVKVPFLNKERMNELIRKYDYHFPDVKTRGFNRRLKKILEKLAESVPSLLEEYPTNLTHNEIRREKNYLSMYKMVANGEKLSADQRKQYRESKKYAEEHNGSPLYKRNKNGTVLMRKYEIVSSHTARRSTITNLYKRGIFEKRELMAISGHTTERNCERYIKVTKDEMADRVDEKLIRDDQV
jgi:integrase